MLLRMRATRDPDATLARTTCALDCPDRCAVLVEKGADRIRLRGDTTHPLTVGFLCRKIQRHPHRLTHRDRITHPWVRTEGREGPFRPADWDEAMSAAVEAIERARAVDPATVMLIRSAGTMGVSKEFIDLVFTRSGARLPIGSLCDLAGIAAIEQDAGALRMNDPREIDGAHAVVLWGKNPRASSVHVAAQVVAARRRGATVLGVTPDESGLRGLADHVVRVRPGRDRFLALAVIKLVLDRVDPPWERTGDRAAFEALLKRLDIDDLLDASEVSMEDVEILAAAYARGPRVATIVGWGIQRYRAGAETVRALHALSFVAGSLGQPGGGFYYNVASSAAFTPLETLVDLADQPGVATPLHLPTLADDLAKADPPVRVAWLTSTNIVNQGPDAHALRREFERIDTVIAVEAFWTETARTATIVLPPTLWLEEEDVVGSAWRSEVASVRRIVDPPHACRTDFDIAMDLADRLGVDVPWRTLDDWLAARLPGGRRCLADLRDRGWLDREEDRIAWQHGSGHADGLFRLLTSLTPISEPHPDRPLHLLTLVRGGAMHSQMDASEQAGPLDVRLHPVTARSHGLREGTAVRITSKTGALEGVLTLDANLHETAVACPRGGWIEYGQGVNLATEPVATDLGDGTAFYETMVRVEPV
jgi:anaerobic selenocysteine-containing dehydrogenase